MVGWFPDCCGDGECESYIYKADHPNCSHIVDETQCNETALIGPTSYSADPNGYHECQWVTTGGVSRCYVSVGLCQHKEPEEAQCCGDAQCKDVIDGLRNLDCFEITDEDQCNNTAWRGSTRSNLDIEAYHQCYWQKKFNGDGCFLNTVNTCQQETSSNSKTNGTLWVALIAGGCGLIVLLYLLRRK